MSELSISISPKEVVREYKEFLTTNYSHVDTRYWNTLDPSMLLKVLTAIEPGRVPEVLKKGACPWEWHCYYIEGVTPSYVADGWVKPENPANPGSCFTAVQWWASMYMRNDE
jgi:hypothetical protein